MLAILRGIERGMFDAWGNAYFTTAWTHDEAVRRGDATRGIIAQGGQELLFKVSTEPLAAIISSPYVGDLISDETIHRANVGIWRLELFNGFLQQQTDMFARHADEIVNGSPQRRVALADAFARQSGALGSASVVPRVLHRVWASVAGR